MDIFNALQRNILSNLYLKNVYLKNCRTIYVSSICSKSQSGRYKVTPKGDRPLTYEMANPPHRIAHRKSWNSFNTSNLLGGLRAPETAVEDVFIRKFMMGTWHNLIANDVIIKRQHNVIRIAVLVRQAMNPRKMYFLLGYTEELLSSWLQCPVMLEIQTIEDKFCTIYKYV